jgi:hypothetical protein
MPAPLAVKTPKLEFTTRTGAGLLREPLKMTRMVTDPGGVWTA